MITVTPLAIPDVKLVAAAVHSDPRGDFLEAWHARDFADAGLPATFVQDNISRSVQGCLRGLHFQRDHPQGKLVRVVHGAVRDVAVDIRRSSPTFGRWVSAVLDDRAQHALWIPEGFAHGFLALEPATVVHYKCTTHYVAGDSRTIRWDDAALGIDWGTDRAPILSPADAAAPWLADAPVFP